MKNIILTTIFGLLLISISVFSQNDLKYERTDSIAKSKNQIYSATKMFISEYWKSAKDVIQNDDKEGGLVLIKGEILIYAGTGIGSGPYKYSYTIKFLFKDNRYKIVIYNIVPEMNAQVHSPEICNNCEFPGTFKINMYKERWILVQQNFPIEMNKILNDYSTYLKENSVENW